MEPKPTANELWLVLYEGRFNVVAISPKGDGFFAPGQEPLWPLSEACFIRKIIPPSKLPMRAMEYGLKKGYM